jgi:pimeloyl-ACP methyl ester carboxylesterase
LGLAVPTLSRPDGVQISWEERGKGPPVVFSPFFFNRAPVFADLLDDLAVDHRVVTWDLRGTGSSSRIGPFGFAADIGDLEQLLEVVGGGATLLDMMAPRSIPLGAARLDLVDAVVITGASPPLGSEEQAGVEGFAGSRQVSAGLIQLLESDYRSGLHTLIQSTNPQMREEEIRARVDDAATAIEHAAAVGRLKALRDVRALSAEAAALGARLTVVYFDSQWYGEAMFERARELLPEARIEPMEDGPISRPDLTAAAVRRVTEAART